MAVSRRDQPSREKQFIGKEAFLREITDLLAEIQSNLLERAEAFLKVNLVRIDSKDEFDKFFAESAPGGFALAHWAGSNEEEERISKEFKVTIRCIPNDGADHGDDEEGACFYTGKPSRKRVVFARAY